MLGGKNPSDPAVWATTCGRCHPYQLERVRSSLMYTNTGIVKNTQLTWEGMDGKLYGARGDEVFDAGGNPVTLTPVADLDHISGELYRKFCALCHVGIQSDQVYAASHAAGCAACHFPYAEDTVYRGGDPTVHGKWPYSASHAMAALPENETCVRCHNRSGRIGLYYEGWNDGNNSLVPTRNGLPGPKMIGGARNATAIAPDVHHAKGLECIDCHTSRDLMGDGYAYENLYRQIEVRCEDCHGSPREVPHTAEITRENEDPLRESRQYPRPMHPGDRMVLTGKGRKYSNVFQEAGKVWVQGKRSGKLHESRVVTGTPEHTIVGHERLDCTACHSRTVAQCYGCHTQYDQSTLMTDFIRGRDTPGHFTETEDYRSLYPFPLALNQHGTISPVTPGCQTLVTVLDASGTLQLDEYVAQYKGRRQFRFAPFFSHNTGPRAVGCRECHGNPAFAGFGQAAVDRDGLDPTFLCVRSADRSLDGFVRIEDGQVRPYSAITREGGRPLDTDEVRRFFAVNLCLVCHDDPKDPIYQKPLDPARLGACLRLAADRQP